MPANHHPRFALLAVLSVIGIAIVVLIVRGRLPLSFQFQASVLPPQENPPVIISTLPLSLQGSKAVGVINQPITFFVAAGDAEDNVQEPDGRLRTPPIEIVNSNLPPGATLTRCDFPVNSDLTAIVYCFSWTPTKADVGSNRFSLRGYEEDSGTYGPTSQFIVNVNDPTLLAYWQMDEASGIHLTDFSGNNNNGTMGGSPLPSWVSAAGGFLRSISALSFGGPNHDVVTINSQPSLNLNVGDRFSFSFWIKGQSGLTGIFSHLDNTLKGYALTVTNDNRVQLVLESLPNYLGYTSVAPLPAKTDFAHVVVTYDGALADPAQRVHIFADRIDLGTTFEGSDPVPADITATTPSFIGLVLTAYATMVIDDLRIYSGIISPSDVVYPSSSSSSFTFSESSPFSSPSSSSSTSSASSSSSFSSSASSTSASSSSASSSSSPQSSSVSSSSSIGGGGGPLCGNGIIDGTEECDDGKQCAPFGVSCTSDADCQSGQTCQPWDGDGCFANCSLMFPPDSIFP